MLDIQENIPLAQYTTFGIGGPARYFCEVNGDHAIHDAVAWAQERKIPFTVIAGGSNILVSDTGFNGLVIRIRMLDYAFEKGVLHAGAGCNLLTVIRLAASRRLGGWEKLAGIPGSIGGAIRGNAGAFGKEIKDFVTTVEAFNTLTGETKTFLNGEMGFAYRTSFFKTHPEWVILRAAFVLEVTDQGESDGIIAATISERERRHLQDVRAAGSYFMNPTVPADILTQFESEKKTIAREGRVPAGWLIEKAGMRGHSVGGAQASKQHPNYLLNMGTATAADIRTLAEKIKAAVKEIFKVELQEEVVKIG